MSAPSSSTAKKQVEGGNNNFSDLQFQLLEAKQQISRLKEDNLTLKSQYEEAIKFTKQMDEVHQENAVLTRTVRKITAEKDEISRRLQISLQMNEDLKKKPEPQPSCSRSELNELRESLEKNKKNHFSQISELNSTLQETTQILNSVRTENSDLKSIINGLIEAAESYFGDTFSSHESLRQFLLLPKPKIEAKIPQTIETPPPIDTSTINCYKNKIKNEKKLRKEIAQKLINSEKENQVKNDHLQSKINELESKIADLQKNTKDNELRLKQEIASSSSQISIHTENIDRLKSRIQQLKEQNEKLEELQNRPNPLSPEVNDLKNHISAQNDKLKESSASITTLKKQISSLIGQLKTSELKINTLKKKVNDANALNDDCNNELVELRTEKSRLELVNEELREKIKTANSQLKADRSSFQQSSCAFEQLEANFNRCKSSNSLLQNYLDKQKEEISSLYRERDRLISLIQLFNSLLKESEDYYNSALTKYNSKPKKQKKEIETKIVETVVEPEIPITSWFSTEFPRDLTNMISDVAKNEALPINAKLRHILTIIGKYYNSQIEDSEKSIKRKDDVINEISDTYHNFLIAIGYQIEADLSNSSDPSKYVIEWIMSIKDQKSSAALQKDAVESDVTNFLDKLELKSLFDAEKYIDQLNIELNSAQNELIKERKRAKRQKKSQRELGENFADHQKEIEDVFNRQKSKIEELEKMCDNYIVEIRQLKNKNTELSNDIIRLKNEHEDQVGEVSTERNAFLRQMRDEYEKEKTEYITMIEDKSFKIENYCKQIVKLEKDATQWKRVAESMKKHKKGKDKEIAELSKQIEENECIWKERLIKEKANFSTQFNTLITELKSKNKELRALVSNTSEALNESENRVKALSAQLADSERINQQNILKIESQKEEIEREKQLIDTKIKASSLSNDMKFQKMIEEERSKQETEKRKLFGFVAKSFSQFFDGRKQLTDDCFKALIKTAADEIDRLLAEEAAIRRLLGIGPNESPQDSVAKLLLFLYKPN